MENEEQVVSEEIMETPADLLPDTDPDKSTGEEPKPEGDTETETPAGDTNVATPDELEEEFKALGLDRKYANYKEALRAMPHLFDRLGRIENELYNQPKQKVEPEKELDTEAFLEEWNRDPAKAVKKLTEPQLAELRQGNAMLYGEVLDTKKQLTVARIPELQDILPDFERGVYPVQGKNKYWDAIAAYAIGNPIYRGQPDHVIIADAFARVKDRVKATEKPKVEKVPDKVKASANTAGGPKKAPTDPNWNNLTPRQMKERAERAGLVSDE